MAARLTKRLSIQHRESIKTSMLINRLMNHADPESDVIMTPSQIRAAEILLNKTLPNLTATEIDATIDDSRPETMSDSALIAIAGGRKD